MDPEAGQGMEGNDGASEALPDIFGIPVILNHILEQLPNSQLLQLSLVNKFWKKIARIVMKRRGNVMVLLDSHGYRVCGKAFQVFADNLETFNETAYSGMTIRLRSGFHCQETGALELGAIHESILAGMRGILKRLSISIHLDSPTTTVCWNNPPNCPNFLLLRLLLRDFIGDLEHLTLQIREITEPFIQQYLPHGPYPKLKVLKLDNVFRETEEETFSNQIKLLLSRAPNLQEIHTAGNVSLRKNLMEGREDVVHVHETHVLNPMQDISENVIPALRLKRTSFIYDTEPELGLERFNEKAQSLLRTCCATTLEYLDLERVSSLFLLMSYGIQLINVKELQIFLDYVELEQFEPRIRNMLSRFDFAFLFPNVKMVGIYTPMRNLGELSRDIMDAIIEQANAGRAEPTLARAGNIKHLRLYQDSISVDALQFFAHMFPAIQELHFGTPDVGFPVESSWELWPDLKLIYVRRKRYQRPQA